MVGREPCKLALDFHVIEGLLLDPDITEADVIEGVSIALRRATKRMNSWGKFTEWIRNAAKDRLARIPRPERRAAVGPPQAPKIGYDGGRADHPFYPDDHDAYPQRPDSEHEHWGFCPVRFRNAMIPGPKPAPRTIEEIQAKNRAVAERVALQRIMDDLGCTEVEARAEHDRREAECERWVAERRKIETTT